LSSRARFLHGIEPEIPTFHWEIELPEVFLETIADGSLQKKAEGGFDTIVGNPPFAGKNTMAEGNAKGYPDWLKAVHPESHGNADLVSHFFRRAFNLIRPVGTLGLIATNTIGQGDTRSTGLRWICNHGGTIYAARKRLKWPGEAAVVVSLIHVHRGSMDGSFELDGQPTKLITAFLFPSGGNDDPERLHANAGKSFVGSYVLGMGFTFDDTDKKGVASPVTRARADELAKSGERRISMEELIANDPRNQEQIFPYIGGKEVNDSPTHTHHRYVINFAQMSQQEARRWPELMQIVEDRVKPERDKLGNNTDALNRKRNWWLWGRYTPALYNSLRGLDRLLVICRHQPHWGTAFLAAGAVYSEATIIIASSSVSVFSALQTRPHELWARSFGSSMKDDLRYTPSDCFETFPFPPDWQTNSALETIGKGYYDYRAQLMIDSNKGLTKTYNRFHDPKEKSPEIKKLRDLHTAMDRAVLAAYGWSDIDTTCGFDLDWCESEAADDASPDTIERLDLGRYFFASADDARAFAAELQDGAKLPWRFRWRPEVRDEVLACLLLLNKERAEAERLLGLSTLVAASADDDDILDEDAHEVDESDEDD
jgi:hypothetical protein